MGGHADGEWSGPRCQGCRNHGLRGARMAIMRATRIVKVETGPLTLGCEVRGWL